MVKVSKSNNLRFYPLFFHYPDPVTIPYNVLAYSMGVEPNKLRALKGEAQNNVNIFLALLNDGYTDDQIPSWFKRPSGLLKKRVIVPSSVKVAERKTETDQPKLTAPVKENQPLVRTNPVFKHTPTIPRPYVLLPRGSIKGIPLYEKVDQEEHLQQQARLEKEQKKKVEEEVAKIVKKYSEIEKRKKQEANLKNLLKTQFIWNNREVITDLILYAYTPVDHPIYKSDGPVETTIEEIKLVSKEVERKQIFRKILEDFFNAVG